MSLIDLYSIGLGLAVFLSLHVFIWRVRPSNAPRVFLLGLLGVLGMGISALASALLEGFSPLKLSSIVWVDLFFVLFYMFIYAGIARSVSLTLLSRLHRLGDKSLNLEAFVLEYAESSRFEDRIHLMAESGFVRITEGQVMLTPKGTRLARWSKNASSIMGTRLQG